MQDIKQLSKLLFNRIIQDGEVTLTRLEHLANQRGVSLSDLYTALETIHRDKRIARKVLKGEVVYTPAPKPKLPGSHLSWTDKHYPWPEKFVMPFPEIDVSFIFLKTKEERDAFKAEMSGRPVYTKSKYVTARKTNRS
jgi:hypothetical protein